MKKVLFITKPFVIEPLGIMYLISALKNAGHQVQLITTDEDYETIVLSTNPDIVAYSIMTGDEEFYDRVNWGVTSCGNRPFTIAGGPHPTFFPELLDKSSFDAICVGEGEKAIVELANDIDRMDIQNLHFQGYNKNPVRPLEDDINGIIFPDREEVFKFDHIRNGPIKHFIASRGCPYNCSYCFNHAYGELYKDKGPRVRFRSVDNVLDEIWKVTLGDKKTKFIYFQDDTFILKSKWIEEFSVKYIEQIGLPFHCHCRANLVTEDIVSNLWKSGCRSVHLAVECGNEKIREKLLNRYMSNKQIEYAMKKFKRYNIRVMLQNIIGLPGTTLENDLETLEFNIKLKPTYSWVSIFQPYPKTDLGKFSVKIGDFDGDFSILNNNFFDSSPLHLPHKKQLAQLQKLFAFTVKNPALYDSGILEILLNSNDDFSNMYEETRKSADKELYGFEL